MMSDFWGEATYVALDGGESIDAAEYDSFCDAYRVDETRFLRAEQHDGSCLVFEALFSNGEAVAAFRVENVPEIFLQTKTAVRKGCITMRKNMRMPWRENRKNIKNGSIVLPFFVKNQLYQE